MKKLLVIVVLMLTASPAAFAGNWKPVQMRSNPGFWNGFLGTPKDNKGNAIQNCRTAIQGDVSPLETAALMAVTKNGVSKDNAAGIAAIFAAIK
ncbi:MAG: hypothetical protein WCQ53_01720 [bacterium]